MPLPEHRVGQAFQPDIRCQAGKPDLLLEHNRNQDNGELPAQPIGVDLPPAIRADLLDPALWQDGLAKYACATNLAVALADAAGCLIGEYINPRPTWSLLHAKTPPASLPSAGAAGAAGGVGCPFSLAPLQSCNCVADALARGGFVVARDRTGLVHFAVPLVLGEHPLGALVAGQVFDQYPEQLPLEQVAKQLGLSPVPVWQRARQEHPVKKATLRVYADLLTALGQAFLQTCYHTILEAERLAEMTRLRDRAAAELAERVQAEEALGRSRDQIATILASITDGFITFDHAWRITYLNRKAEELLSRLHKTPGELLGKNPWEEYPALIGTQVDEECHRAVRQPVPVAFEFFYPPFDGWFEVNAYPSADGLAVYFLEITDRKRVEEALRGAHDRLEKRVEQRTAELKTEIAAHKQAEAARMALVQQLITAQEVERHRIARELHDQMGQHLTALILGLKSLKDATAEPSPARARLQQLQELTDLIGKEVHHLALELRPTALDDLGLHTTLVNYVEGWSERSGVEVDFHSTGLDTQRLPAALETALYRIVQEGLTNVLKHAQARRVSLILHRSPDQVRAILEDDGRGFDAEAVINSAGAAGRLGLLGMRERVALVGGTLTIESTPGHGTTIFVRIPLPADDKEDSDD